MRLSFLDVLAYLLTILGGINWGLARVFNYNLVDHIVPAGTTASKIIYGLVGLAAVYSLFVLLRNPARAERAERMERESGHEREREDLRMHPADRTERVDRESYGTTGRRQEDRRRSRRR